MGDQVAYPLDLVIALLSGSPAHDQQPGIAGLEAPKRLDRHIDSLERLDSADEQQHRLVTEPEGSTSAGSATGREESVIDSRRDDLDATGIGTVELDELTRLGLGVGRDHVGAPHHLGLGIDA